MRGESWLGIEEDVVPIQGGKRREGPPVTNTTNTRASIAPSLDLNLGSACGVSGYQSDPCFSHQPSANRVT
jgi:hypothetical protein